MCQRKLLSNCIFCSDYLLDRVKPVVVRAIFQDDLFVGLQVSLPEVSLNEGAVKEVMRVLQLYQQQTSRLEGTICSVQAALCLVVRLQMIHRSQKQQRHVYCGLVLQADMLPYIT